MNIKDFTYYYFVGIGGIGMSALARYFNLADKKVLGYDKTPTPLTYALEKEGIKVSYEDALNEDFKHLNAENCLVIFTPAIKNLQILDFFKQNNFTILKRSKVLGLLTRQTNCLAIAGTHGKTTTSCLLGHLMHVAGKPCTAFLGGIAENYQSNMILGGTEINVVEADEFDRSFLQLSPNYAAITSMDADHLDIYGEKEELEKSFLEFAALVENKVFAKKGLNVPNSQSYGVETEADYSAQNIRIEENHYLFDLYTPSQTIKDIVMPLPGRHNIENAVAAIAIALENGVSEDDIKKGLASFKGVKRRFTRHTCPNGKVIIDDYAHHPMELKAIISATQNFYPNKKILGVFQPHLFSRTKDFGDDFAKSLNALEELILLDIYPAREEPIEGITSEWLAKKMDKKPEISSLSNAIKTIKNRNFDVLLLMGAGDIANLYEPLKELYNEA
ncbi:UDP-N-acetylmuramate--L-alanine ligase [Ornithobacterium rhinotracheale]|uniref:UDP-N-acetylmuramate--L-alanine ligase n=1 Tax=Ornithobacterium rhinotracheale TaxID=28251 RepID=UPI00129CA62C|nr:UDP-N-acetylmuramate--L-alanine ligase [Ornithobacterium rhinotracheale]UOH77701.1 UDP-N-acetylmuramate--L-alanine ligase [Ornithobacterium rhinotracheale]